VLFYSHIITPYLDQAYYTLLFSKIRKPTLLSMNRKSIIIRLISAQGEINLISQYHLTYNLLIESKEYPYCIREAKLINKKNNER
jgi:hypothetical protein